MYNIFHLLVRLICSFIPVKSIRKETRNFLNIKFGLNDYNLFKSCFIEIKCKKISANDLLSAKCCFLGSSHVACGFNPMYFSQTSLNLGSMSQDLFTSYSLYKNFLKDLPNLKHIFLEYSIFSNGLNLAKTKASHICSIYKYLYGIEYFPQNYVKNFAKICRKLDKCKLKTIKNYNGYLYPKSDILNAQMLDRATKHLREHHRQESQHIWIESLKKILDDKQKLYIVIFPLRTDFKEIFPDSQTLFNELYKLTKTLNIELINFYNDTDFIFEDFQDCDHLNEQGAIKLSTKLKDKLLERRNHD